MYCFFPDRFSLWKVCVAIAKLHNQLVSASFSQSCQKCSDNSLKVPLKGKNLSGAPSQTNSAKRALCGLLDFSSAFIMRTICGKKKMVWWKLKFFLKPSFLTNFLDKNENVISKGFLLITKPKINHSEAESLQNS